MTETDDMMGMRAAWRGCWQTGVVTMVLLSGGPAAMAQQPYAHSGSGEVLTNSARECWQAVGGVPAWCGDPGDSDGDGVKDDQDRCPGTPAGAAVDADGCPPDADRDGVPDHADACPDTPYGVRVDGRGCALDLDGDGVPYYRDRCCQSVPSGGQVDSEGCLVRLTLENVHFNFDSAELRPDARRILDELVATLSQRADVERIMIGGHADSIGSTTYNQGLSERRARSVVRYLRESGVKQPVRAEGYGESRPTASNATDQGRAKNRRVEIELESVPEMRR